MLLNLSFPSLLTCVLLVLFTSRVNSLPHLKRSTDTVTLPLKRVEHSRSDVHPQILLQQHINRSNRRLARMSGRRQPTAEELRDNLHKRILSVEGPEGLFKRYNRIGVPKPAAKIAKTKAKTNKKASSGAVKASSVAKNQAVSLKNQVDTNGDKDEAGADQTAQTNGKGETAPTAKGTSQGNNKGAESKVPLDATNSTAASGNTPATASNTTAATGAASGATASQAADGVTAANAPTGANSLGLDIEANDVGYLATVQMGTPPQDFLILMDSGSADLWVGAEDCQSDAGGGCGNHQFLGTKSSSTFKDTKSPFQVTYGTGQVSGDIIQDNIAIAGLSLKAHTFGVATKESVDFSSDATPIDELMDLAQSTLSKQKTPTPIESLASAGLVKSAITSYKISRLADNKNDGEITFGGLDATKFDAKTLVSLPNVNKAGFWEGALDAVSVDGTDLGLKGRTAILDTGTTLIVAPAADAATIHQNIQGAKSDGQGGFTVPCTTTASVALTFGGTSFAIDPRDIAFQPVDAADPTGDCVSGISSGNIGGANEWLVGDVFLKNAYFSTDVTKNTVSLAKLI